MEDSEKNDDSMSTLACQAPITARHKIRDDLDSFIPKPYLARAFVCPDTNHPNGTPGQNHHGMTVLQQHLSYFDRNGDGIVYPWETCKALHALGFNWIISLLACILVHVLFSYPTLPGWIPSVLLPIYIKNGHKLKHASDSSTYDTEGRFVPATFENMFSKYAGTVPDKLTLREIWNMTEGNKSVYDLTGRLANKLEWGFLYYIARDGDGLVSKEDVRNCFDGSLFRCIAHRRQQHRHWQ